MEMKPLLLLLCLPMISCVAVKDGLTVKQYHLREDMFDEDDDLMVRGEVQRMLHGAVTMEERKEKIGQYYHVTWKEQAQSQQPVQVVFEYLQAASGSNVKTMERKGNCHEGRFETYFSVAGQDYQKKGRVLAWRISAKRNNKELASKRSYMWR